MTLKKVTLTLLACAALSGCATSTPGDRAVLGGAAGLGAGAAVSGNAGGAIAGAALGALIGYIAGPMGD